MEINLTLTKEEASYIVNVLAELPTKTGAWTLIKKLMHKLNHKYQQQKRKRRL